MTRYEPLANAAVRVAFSTRSKAGALVAPDVMGTITLFSDGAAQPTPMEAVTIEGAGGRYFAVVDNTDASLQGSGFFANAKPIRLWMGDDLVVDGVAGCGGWFSSDGKPDYVIGTPPTVAAIREEMDAESTKLAAIDEAAGDLQADWVDGGRLDLLLDAIQEAVDATRAIAENLPDGGALNDLSTLQQRLTSARAALLDKLDVSGNVAASSEVTAIQNNTRVVRTVPTMVPRPASGTATYRVELFLYDGAGNMEAPDAAPTVDLVDEAGNGRTGRLDSTTMTLVSTGRYRVVYTASAADDLEQLTWAFSVVEGGATRLYGNTTLVVDAVAVDFTADDRTKLQAIHGKLSSAPFLLGGSASDGSGYATSTQATAIEGKADDAVAAIGDLHDFDPASDRVKLHASQDDYAPSKAGDEMALTTAARNAVRNGLATGVNVTDAQTAIIEAMPEDGLSLGDTVGASPPANSVELALRRALDGLPIGGGGPRAVTLTVRDQSNALVAGVRVVLNNGGRDFVGWSDAGGLVALSLSDGPHDCAAEKNGYSHVPQTFTVSAGSVAFTVLVVASGSVEPSPDPDVAVGWAVGLSPEGARQAGVGFSVQLVEGDETAGLGLSSAIVTKATDADGLVTFDLLRGKRYRAWRGDDDETARPFTVPVSQETFPLPELIGSP